MAQSKPSSTSKKKSKATHDPSPDPASRLKEMYDQMWKETAKQWDQLLRNPVYLSTMAATIEQSMNWTDRVQEMVATTLKTMQMPTRDDVRELKESLQSLRQEVASLHSKLDAWQSATTSKKRSRKRS